MKRDRVIIVREQDEIVAACCVPFEGGFVKELGKLDLFLSTTEMIQSTGELYQRLKNDYGHAVDIDIVDPRNQGYLFPRLIKDIIHFKVPMIQALKTIFALKVPAIIYNGRLISSGKKQFSSKTYQYLKQELQNNSN